jgi:GNAT superfamily N-acetyltransferase
MTTDTATNGALVLGDGRRFLIRPLSSRDRDQLGALFLRLGPESRLSRFFSPKRELTPRELTFFTEVDQVRHAALAAVDARDLSIVAVARYVTYTHTPATAEVAVEVADDLQRAGIGTYLMTRIVERAVANRVAVLTARTRYGNPAGRALSRRLGFRPSAGGGGAETCWQLDLRASGRGKKSSSGRTRDRSDEGCSSASCESECDRAI